MGGWVPGRTESATVATFEQWVEGARPRTLPAAVAPVLVGSAVAAWDHSFLVGRALLALVVALALQVGVNYANDYSDGVRGTDEARVGPVRLVGQRLAAPARVRAAALAAFGVAAVAGFALVLVTSAWWLLLVGAAAIVAAWLYTGGPRPYGYAGLGEVFVFVFFGLVAVAGTTYVQTGTVTALSLLCATSTGLLVVAILVANNLRDIPGDTAAGKRTLAVRLGDARTRSLFRVTVLAGLVVPAAVSALALLDPMSWPAGAVLGLGAILPAAAPLRAVAGGAAGRALVPVLVGSGRTVLIHGVLLSAGIVATIPFVSR